MPSTPTSESRPLLVLLLGLSLALLLKLTGCNATASYDAGFAIFEVEVTGERFRIRVDDPDQIAEAERLLQEGASSIVQGDLAHGDGGFNAPYRWHLRPETLHFPDMTTEVCSGRPQSDVEADPAYWVDTLGTYCPWGARIVERIE